jgi:ABC-2 type transport system ATP-binding protein
MNVIETHALGKSYGSTRALNDCTLAIPDEHVVALVGPNGAGKSTLLNLAVGLATPTSGKVAVLGGHPAGSLPALDGIAFVAQDTPLYKNLSAADLLRVTRNLNRRFDEDYAEHRLRELGIPLQQKAGKMSGGQQAQLALTLALARRPQLLVLDEPMAMLDPLARHDFMATVMMAVADDGVSVVLSSHVLAELERVADYLVLLSRGSVQMVGEVDDLLATHRLLTGPASESERHAREWSVVHASRAASQAHLLVRCEGTSDPVPSGWEAHPVTLEELTLSYLREPSAAALPGPARGWHAERSEVAR